MSLDAFLILKKVQVGPNTDLGYSLNVWYHGRVELLRETRLCEIESGALSLIVEVR